ncbi:hypothetical protein ACC728_18655 [Rhizobium ruizarguesonis]
MTTININGQRITVDDSFLSLSPEEQNKAVDEILQQFPKPAGAVDKSFKGAFLPISKDADGNRNWFDTDAGFIGAIKRAVMLPGDVYSGKVQMNGLDGRTSPEAIGRSLEFASTFIPGSPALHAGEQVIPGVTSTLRTPKMIEPPSAADLFAEALRNAKTMRDSGVDFALDAVKGMAEAAKGKLDEEGLPAGLAGKTHQILDELANPPPDSVADIKGLYSARETFKNIKKVSDGNEQSAASKAIRGLDEFITADDPAAVVAGPGSDAAQALKAGNANEAAAMRSQKLTELSDSAKSGANAGKTTRQRLSNLLLDEKQTAAFSPEELKLLRAVNEGNIASNSTRAVGNLLDGGRAAGAGLLGLAGAVASGFPKIGATVTSLPLVGTISRNLSNALTERALQQVERGVRRRSPLYQSRLESAPKEAVYPWRMDALVRALLLSRQQQEDGKPWI